jgi:hypothetical protein
VGRGFCVADAEIATNNKMKAKLFTASTLRL